MRCSSPPVLAWSRRRRLVLSRRCGFNSRNPRHSTSPLCEAGGHTAHPGYRFKTPCQGLNLTVFFIYLLSLGLGELFICPTRGQSWSWEAKGLLPLNIRVRNAHSHTLLIFLLFGGSSEVIAVIS